MSPQRQRQLLMAENRSAQERPNRSDSPKAHERSARGEQSFAIRCECGRMLRGRRDVAHREVACPACGAALFILPRNPRRRPAGLDSTNVPAVVRTNRTEEDEKSSTATSTASPRGRGLFHRGARSVASAASDIRDSAVKRPFLASGRVRLFLAGLAALMAITLAWYHRRQTHYDHVLNVAREEAQGALIAGDYRTAADRSRAAAEAARILRDNTERGRAAVQLAREANVWDRLALTPLESLTAILDGARSDDGALDVRHAQAEFERLFAGRTILIDAWITVDEGPSPQGEAQSRPTRTARLEWLLAGNSSRVELALGSESILDALDLAHATRVLVGAELATLEPPAAPSASWTMRIRAGSATLMTVPEPFARANWPTVEPLAPILEQQRQWALGDAP